MSIRFNTREQMLDGIVEHIALDTMTYNAILVGSEGKEVDSSKHYEGRVKAMRHLYWECTGFAENEIDHRVRGIIADHLQRGRRKQVELEAENMIFAFHSDGEE